MIEVLNISFFISDVIPTQPDDREATIQQVIMFTDISRASTEVALLRLRYLREHPKTCPSLLVVDIDYTFPGVNGRPFTLQVCDISDTVIRDAMGGFSNLLKAAMLGGSYQFTVTTLLGRIKRTSLVILPMFGTSTW